MRRLDKATGEKVVDDVVHVISLGKLHLKMGINEKLTPVTQTANQLHHLFRDVVDPRS